jgi:RimJ/RimL family protein N-acetyltransferase
MEQPTLKTPRLLLRSFTIADAPTVHRFASAYEIAAMTLSIPHPYTVEMAEDWIQTHLEHWQAGMGVNFAIALRQTGELFGSVGIGIEPDRTAEMGYWIGVPFWGRGYATEAAQALLDFGFRDLGLTRIHAAHFLNNPASGKVMHNIGMRHIGRYPNYVVKWGESKDVGQYALSVAEWQAIQLNQVQSA